MVTRCDIRHSVILFIKDSSICFSVREDFTEDQFISAIYYFFDTGLMYHEKYMENPHDRCHILCWYHHVYHLLHWLYGTHVLCAGRAHLDH